MGVRVRSRTASFGCGLLADHTTDDSSGSKDRATVALVLSKVETVAEKVDGHKELTKLGFENVQRQLDDVRGLPTKVAELEQTVEGVWRASIRWKSGGPGVWSSGGRTYR